MGRKKLSSWKPKETPDVPVKIAVEKAAVPRRPMRAPKVQADGEKKLVMQETDRDAFILANHEHLTYQDMAEELGMAYEGMRHCCKRLGVKPISPAEQRRKYIVAYGHRKTLEELVALLGINEGQIQAICHRYGVILVQQNKEERKPWLSPREVFRRATYNPMK